MNTPFQLQLFQTSDVHGYVFPHTYTSNQEQDLGLAKVQTLLKQQAQPNHILIDTGDIIQGSPLTYYHAKKGTYPIHPLATVINHMGYDYVTIGNHEFNYGLQTLHEYIDHLQPTILNANLLSRDTNKPFVGVSHDIRTYKDGPTIAFIGVTTHYIPNWEQPSHIDNLIIKNAFDTTKDLVQTLRQQSDFIIVNYHGGFERDFTDFELEVEDTGENQGSRMLLEIEGIDLLLTGHQHRSLHGTVNGTTYVQPGFNGQTVAEIMINATFDNTWSFQLDTTLHSVEKYPADPTILSLLQDVEASTQQFLDQTVGTLDQDYSIANQLEARLHKHPLISFINQIQLDYTNADISMCSLGNNVSGFQQEITIRDVIGTYLFPNTLVVKAMTGEEVIKAIEKTATFFAVEDDEIVISDSYNHPKLQLYAYDMYDPIEYTLNISKPEGNRISAITFHNKPFDTSKTYSVVMNNYRASGGGDYLFLQDCPTINDTQKEVIELLLDYILDHKHITIDHRENITITK